MSNEEAPLAIKHKFGAIIHESDGRRTGFDFCGIVINENGDLLLMSKYGTRVTAAFARGTWMRVSCVSNDYAMDVERQTVEANKMISKARSEKMLHS